jgi:dienelactone hydrolase
VQKYRDAAEQYGYIVAASNNSRNGSWDVSAAAAQAMSADLGRRFAIDGSRVYLTGFSGGARVAMMVALAGNKIAGVIASGGGYHDSKPRSSVPFLIYGTAGREDFNYIEMRRLDRALKTPHRVVIFEGGHTLPPDAVALDAIEWMELQAMAAGSRARDEALIDRLLAKRQAGIDEAGESAAAVHLLQAMADDFNNLRDVSAVAARAADLAKRKDIKQALARERSDDDGESRLIEEVMMLEASLADQDRRSASLHSLEVLLARLAKQAAATTDTSERSRARRVLRIMTMAASERTRDQEYLQLLARYRPPAASGRDRD